MIFNRDRDMTKKIYTEEEARQKKNVRQKEYERNTNYAAKAKYAKEKTKRYVVQVIKTTEADILEKLEKQDNKSGYIKSLIRQDIKKNGI